MTEKEFTDWTAKTQGSRHRWTEDDIVRLNGRGALFYRGGEDGVYLRVHKNGWLELGRYEGAVPHIGEASFAVLAKHQFPNYPDALAAAIQLGGKPLVADLFSGGYLRGAELDAEQNCNMAPDGLLNNIAPSKLDLTDGQTFEEILALTPETLPKEIQPGGDKPSLLGQLGQYRDAAQKDTGPAWEPELEL